MSSGPNPPAPSSVRTVAHVVTVSMSLKFLRGHARFMRARGYALIFIAAPDAALEEVSAREGARAVGVPLRRSISPLADLVAVTRLVRVYRRLRVDLVHGHTPKGALVAMISAWLAGVPVRVFHARGLPVETATGATRLLLALADRVTCALATRIIAIGPSMRAQLLRRGYAPAEKVVVLRQGGNGIDATRFDPERHAGRRATLRAELGFGPEDVVVGFVGRMVKDKGVPDLIHAFERARSGNPRLKLLLVGPFEPRDGADLVVRECLRVHGADARHTGEVDDPAPWYAAMDLLALPTRREGFPNVPLEAAAMGLPAIVSDIPPCTDAVLDGRTGTVVPLGDVDALAAAILRYASSEPLRRAHGEAGRARIIADFAPEAIRAALADEYDRLLGAAAAR